jgi:hypothetical protein
MKRYPDIEYSYRPVSYWHDETLTQAILKNIKGEFRRRQIRRALAEGSVEDIPEEILQEAVSENVRQFAGRIHPHLMGGEYLPDCTNGEVEIARISLDSTTHDIISLRATPQQDSTISYSVADEYEGMFAFDLSLTSSALPLTLGELADLLETSKQRGAPGNLIVGFNNHNAEYIGRSTLRHFTSISSEFYPQLARHCEHIFDEWHQEELETEEELL